MLSLIIFADPTLSTILQNKVLIGLKDFYICISIYISLLWEQLDIKIKIFFIFTLALLCYSYFSTFIIWLNSSFYGNDIYIFNVTPANVSGTRSVNPALITGLNSENNIPFLQDMINEFMHDTALFRTRMNELVASPDHGYFWVQVQENMLYLNRAAAAADMHADIQQHVPLNVSPYFGFVGAQPIAPSGLNILSQINMAVFHMDNCAVPDPTGVAINGYNPASSAGTYQPFATNLATRLESHTGELTWSRWPRMDRNSTKFLTEFLNHHKPEVWNAGGNVSLTDSVILQKLKTA